MIYPKPVHNLSWIERLVLFFLPMQTSKDHYTGCWIGYKTWRGRIYVLREWQGGGR